MRRLACILVTAALCGCTSIPNMNSKSENHSCSEKPKCCGCAGMDQCGKNPDGTTCCKPDDCKCSQVSQR